MKSNLCEKCNGFTSLPPQYVLDEMARHGQSPFMCSGVHPIPKHNGWLGDGERVSMWYWHGASVDVLLENESGTEDNRHLSAKQALSLLEWLKQQETVLKQLVVVEEEKK